MITPSPVDRIMIEEATQKQSRCACWFEEWYGQITPSHFGFLCKGSLTSANIECILQSGRHENKEPPVASQWGVIHENDAYKHHQLTSLHGSFVRKMGIYIANAGFIASSPDGVVLNPEGMQ
uniref:YqaJ viral recombinase domain-containing protein n=1 Tax=Amphimedon queenslandica TaxID=400682 RepID=A0A1X7VBA4_AMPQE